MHLNVFDFLFPSIRQDHKSFVDLDRENTLEISGSPKGSQDLRLVLYIATESFSFSFLNLQLQGFPACYPQICSII